ncbi:hypothetical protein [Streptomyces beihaiensis]|uniref:5'-nucleotidase n=1 Tax=Streptomyces beihaiensis TaxID=2984495 RepID=A0ABT3TWX2_9ACTN|nr:hypothetical protein [Streptomyces beihaiensis]MCX3060463.1 hypothetical protein [Streptomyces beihaiensis]
MSKRMLRSVLGAAVVAVALALGAATTPTPGDVAWGSAQVGTHAVSQLGADDVAWGVAPDDVAWGFAPHSTGVNA